MGENGRRCAHLLPPELPVTQRRDDIAAAIRDHQVVIVAGETGSGKTTQLPKICLELGRGKKQLIGHTQPRRIAARSVAERIAEELGTELGDLVGYQVRFTDRTSKASRLKLMTDGILLAELQRPPRELENCPGSQKLTPPSSAAAGSEMTKSNALQMGFTARYPVRVNADPRARHPPPASDRWRGSA